MAGSRHRWMAVGCTSVAASLTLALSACGSNRSEPNESSDAVAGDITVSAAASLSAAFTAIAEAFMVEHPGATVTFNFAGSSELVRQIEEGAPVDVFASADLDSMAELTDAGGTGSEPVVFATNTLQIIVRSGNPSGITGVADLADDDLIVVTCAPEVPCGRYANEVFAKAQVTVTPRSLEDNVNAVVAKVALGEADAGIVYVTDVLAAGAAAAAGVAIPEDVNVVAEYPIALIKLAPNAAGGRAFVEFVLSEHGRRILDSYGFGEP